MKILYRNKIYESVRDFNNFDFDTSHPEPLKDTDEVKVYHGFNDKVHAYLTFKYGLSGKEYVGRLYSYEANNNPMGLFVTPVLKVAKEFASSGYIIELDCKVSELEAPVWSNGSYTVQGQMAGYFKDDTEREAARLKDRDLFSKDEKEFIRNSDRPEVAARLLNMGEKQSLFTGDLNPEMIVRVWYSEKGGSFGDYKAITLEEALATFPENYEDTITKHQSYYWSSLKLFKPNEDFNINVFNEKVKGYLFGDQTAIDLLKLILRDAHDAKKMFWPKQLKQIKETYPELFDEQ